MPLNFEDARLLLKLRFTPSPDGVCPRPFKDIMKDPRFKSFGQPRLTREIQNALKNDPGALQVRLSERSKPIQRSSVLEATLRKRFSLTSVIVVIDSLTTGRSDQVASDDIHEKLGSAAGELLSQGAFIKDQEVVALGSGRAVYHAARPPDESLFTAQQVRLIPLAGALYSRHHAHELNVRLDADNNVGVFASRFSERLQMKFVMHPLVATNPKTVLALLGQDTWKYEPTLAIIGVGLMSEGHRLHSLAIKSSEEKDPTFNPILPDLKRLVMLAAKYTNAEYCPVIDIANHLIHIPQPEIAPDDAATIQLLIRAINKRLIAFNDVQLSKIKEIFLIAGTQRKTAAILALLKSKNLNVKYLCTDAVTAEAIVRADDSRSTLA
jgi:DNA-binding transcriptional regulator LsrR (DeoR family)